MVYCKSGGEKYVKVTAVYRRREMENINVGQYKFQGVIQCRNTI